MGSQNDLGLDTASMDLMQIEERSQARRIGDIEVVGRQESYMGPTRDRLVQVAADDREAGPHHEADEQIDSVRSGLMTLEAAPISCPDRSHRPRAGRAASAVD